MAPDRLGQDTQGGQAATGAYGEGNTGRRLAQGENLATVSDPLVQRQSTRRATSDGESRQTHAGRGRYYVVHSGGEATSHRVAQTTWLSNTSAETGENPESRAAR